MTQMLWGNQYNSQKQNPLVNNMTIEESLPDYTSVSVCVRRVCVHNILLFQSLTDLGNWKAK